MTPVGFEPHNLSRREAETYALDRAATGTGDSNLVLVVKGTDLLRKKFGPLQFRWRQVSLYNEVLLAVTIYPTATGVDS